MSTDERAELHPGAYTGPEQQLTLGGKGNGFVWFFTHFEEITTAVLLAVMIISVCVGVFYRYVLAQPLSWTEEVVLACMVWVCFLGASLAAKTREHIVIDVVLVIVPAQLRRLMEMVALAVVIGVLLVLAWQGTVLVDKTRFMTTTALQMPTGIMYAAIPISAALMIIHNTRHLYRDIRAFAHGEVRDGVR